MVIFGWGFQTFKTIGVVFKRFCNHCKNEEFWVLNRTMTWFTLFFIPVFPYSTKYFLNCPVCQYGLTLEGEALEEMIRLAENNQLLIDGHISAEEHQRRLSVDVQEIKNEEKNLLENKEKLVYCSGCGQEVKFCGNCGVGVTKPKGLPELVKDTEKGS
jgi:hypothetical protein